MNILCFYNSYLKRWNENIIHIIVYIIIIFPLLRATEQPLISYFLEEHNYLVTIFTNEIIIYDINSNGIHCSMPFGEKLNIDSRKLSYMCSLGYLYNKNYEIIFVTVNDSIYYGIDGFISLKLDNNNITGRPSNINPHECIEENGSKN